MGHCLEMSISSLDNSFRILLLTVTLHVNGSQKNSSVRGHSRSVARLAVGG